MECAWHVRSMCLKPLPENTRVEENSEEETPSLWKTEFPVEPVFPKEFILSSHTLNTHGLARQGEATH